MPRDILLDEVKIVIVGETEVNIENYKGILQYSEDQVRIKTAGKTVKIVGEKLVICVITDEDIQVKGVVKNVELEAF